MLPAALGVDATANHVPCLHRIRANYPHGASTHNVCLHETTAVSIERGYLVLADISGYTGYLAECELDHAHGILAELLREVVGGLTPPLTLAAIEGDAVFASESYNHLGEVPTWSYALARRAQALLEQQERMVDELEPVVAADPHANLARLRGRLGEAESSQDDLAA